jgi:hypothetical protein
LHRLLVPLENLTPNSIAALQFANTLATANQGHMTILHVYDRTTSPSKIAWIRAQLTLLVEKVCPLTDLQIEIVPGDDVGRTIVEASQSCDLLVLRSSQRPSIAGGLVISNISAQVTQQLACSLILLGQPHQTS